MLINKTDSAPVFLAEDIKDYKEVQEIKLKTWVTKFSLRSALALIVLLLLGVVYILVHSKTLGESSDTFSKILDIVNVIIEAVFK